MPTSCKFFKVPTIIAQHFGAFSGLSPRSNTILFVCIEWQHPYPTISYDLDPEETLLYSKVIRQGVWPVTNLMKLRIQQVWLWPVTCKKIQQLVSNLAIILLLFIHKNIVNRWMIWSGTVRRTCDLGQVWHFVKSGGPLTCDLSNWIKWYSTTLCWILV